MRCTPCPTRHSAFVSRPERLGTIVTSHNARFLCVAVLVLAFSRPAHAVRTARPKVLAALPHDTSAFTQGLVWHAGSFYESTGRYGYSSLRQVQPATGNVLRSVALPDTEFGEGLALVGERLVQLTWREQLAHTYELSTFARGGDYGYTGEGWGLCFDGQQLVMSDGSDRLQFRDAQSFELRSSVQVTLDGTSLDQLNELECVGDTVLANVWQTTRIVQIDKASGEVLLDIDARGLLNASEAAQADVLNGIAYDPETEHFYITGKLWPWVFEVSLAEVLSPQRDAGAAADAPSVSPAETGEAGAESEKEAGAVVVEPGSVRWDAAIEASDAPETDAATDTVVAAFDVAEAEGAAPSRPQQPDTGVDAASTDAGLDAALDTEAGALADAGLDAAVDAEARADGGAITPPPAPSTSSGCTCGLAARAQGTGFAWLGLFALYTSVRRARRPGRRRNPCSRA